MQNAVLYNMLVFKILVTFGLRGDDRSATAIIAKLEAFPSVQDSVRSDTEFTYCILDRYGTGASGPRGGCARDFTA